MSRRGRADFLRGGTALGLLVIATAQRAQAVSGIREQSPYGQGTSFAGRCRGRALSQCSESGDPDAGAGEFKVKRLCRASSLIAHTTGTRQCAAAARHSDSRHDKPAEGASFRRAIISYQY